MSPEKEPRFELTPKEIAIFGAFAVGSVLLTASLHALNYLNKLRSLNASTNGHQPPTNTERPIIDVPLPPQSPRN